MLTDPMKSLNCLNVPGCISRSQTLMLVPVTFLEVILLAFHCFSFIKLDEFDFSMHGLY